MALSLTAVPVAQATETAPNRQSICDEPTTKYEFGSVARNSRPTSVKSAYITGPGTLSYNKTISTSVAFTASGSVTAEAGVVFAKASATLGISLTTSRSWSDSFTYTLEVPSGQRKAMQLFQESRSFLVTRKTLRSDCTYATTYSSEGANAPRKTRVDEWKLVS